MSGSSAGARALSVAARIAAVLSRWEEFAAASRMASVALLLPGPLALLRAPLADSSTALVDSGTDPRDGAEVSSACGLRRPPGPAGQRPCGVWLQRSSTPGLLVQSAVLARESPRCRAWPPPPGGLAQPLLHMLRLRAAAPGTRPPSRWPPWRWLELLRDGRLQECPETPRASMPASARCQRSRSISRRASEPSSSAAPPAGRPPSSADVSAPGLHCRTSESSSGAPPGGWPTSPISG
mmetsp:Transcript_16566/g.47171  ORF Transcript_16566/g.47171 Transcript_16566/m.47171 type:complete len:238 (-) Transcript_16566:440-1153(-)